MAAKSLPVGSLDAIMAANDARAEQAANTETIEVPEWGCSVVIRGMTRGEIREMPEGLEEIHVAMLTRFVVEPQIDEESARKLVALDRPVDQGAWRVTKRISEVSGLGESFRA